MSDDRQKISGLVLGHHPLLSIAEVLAKTDNSTDIVTATSDALVISCPNDLVACADTFGGVQKIATYMTQCDRNEVLTRACELLIQASRRRNHRKMPYAVSCYGDAEGMQQQILKGLKNALKNEGGHGRFVHKDMHVNAPNVLIRNQVLEDGLDIMVIGQGNIMFVGCTTWVQDIDAYTRRDIKKPRRDMATGMLPPKLAQTLINLTLPHTGTRRPCLWDPFCGLGVIPMETLLMGLPVICSDINPAMEDNTRANLEWLTRDGENVPSFDVYTIDARHWSSVPTTAGMHPDGVVTEGTLGLNFRVSPTREDAEREQEELVPLYEDFFQGLTRPEASTIRAVTLTVPFHILPGGEYFRLMPRLLQTIYSCGFAPVDMVKTHQAQLKRLGLTRSLTEEGTILYTRSKQFVGREIVVLKRV